MTHATLHCHQLREVGLGLSHWKLLLLDWEGSGQVDCCSLQRQSCCHAKQLELGIRMPLLRHSGGDLTGQHREAGCRSWAADFHSAACGAPVMMLGCGPAAMKHAAHLHGEGGRVCCAWGTAAEVKRTAC